MKKMSFAAVFIFAAVGGASHAQTKLALQNQDADCSKYIWSVLQADEMTRVTAQTKGSNSELVSRMRAQKLSECEIKTALQKKMGLQH